MMIYAITCGFIGLDFLTGLIKAFAGGAFKSSTMREGLYHKTGELLCIALGILVNYAQAYIDLGISVPVAQTLCAYIILMEIGSAIENIGVISPEVVPDKIKALFGLKKEDDA